MGAMITIRPIRVEKLLENRGDRFTWYQDKVNLDEQLIVGPFNFQRITKDNKEYNRVPASRWNMLRQFHSQVEVTDIDEIRPLS
jgi:hypothetical protein